MTHDVSYREMNGADLEEVLALQLAALGAGSTPRTPEFWRWKHESSPFGVSPAWVALAGDRIVGLRTFLRWRWRMGERTLAAVRAVDTATHPDWQRRGIFWQLTRQALDHLSEEGCEFVFNTPNRRSGAGYRKLGWRQALKPSIRVRAVKPLRMAGAALSGGERRPASLGELPKSARLLKWARLDELLDRYDADWTSRLYTPRDRKYLGWRYRDVPEIDYRGLWTSSGDAMAAMVVRTRLRRSMRELLVSELLTAGDETARRRLLDRLFEKLLGEVDIDYLVASAPAGSRESAALRASGFRRVPSGPSLMIRPLASGLGEAELAGDRWQLSIGDLEVF